MAKAADTNLLWKAVYGSLVEYSDGIRDEDYLSNLVTDHVDRLRKEVLANLTASQFDPKIEQLILTLIQHQDQHSKSVSKEQITTKTALDLLARQFLEEKRPKQRLLDVRTHRPKEVTELFNKKQKTKSPPVEICLGSGEENGSTAESSTTSEAEQIDDEVVIVGRVAEERENEPSEKVIDQDRPTLTVVAQQVTNKLMESETFLQQFSSLRTDAQIWLDQEDSFKKKITNLAQQMLQQGLEENKEEYSSDFDESESSSSSQRSEVPGPGSSNMPTSQSQSQAVSSKPPFEHKQLEVPKMDKLKKGEVTKSEKSPRLSGSQTSTVSSDSKGSPNIHVKPETSAQPTMTATSGSQTESPIVCNAQSSTNGSLNGSQTPKEAITEKVCTSSQTTGLPKQMAVEKDSNNEGALSSSSAQSSTDGKLTTSSWTTDVSNWSVGEVSQSLPGMVVEVEAARGPRVGPLPPSISEYPGMGVSMQSMLSESEELMESVSASPRKGLPATNIPPLVTDTFGDEFEDSFQSTLDQLTESLSNE